MRVYVVEYRPCEHENETGEVVSWHSTREEAERAVGWEMLKMWASGDIERSDLDDLWAKRKRYVTAYEAEPVVEVHDE